MAASVVLRCNDRRHESPRRLVPLLLTVLLLLLLCAAACPSHAYVYDTPVAASQFPATYAAKNPAALPIRGLHDACVGANNPSVSANNRGALVVNSDNVSAILAAAVTTGQVYLGGFYVPSLGPDSGWCWDDGSSTACPGLFCLNATCDRVANTTFPLSWAAGYPMLDASGKVGTRKYIAYDADKKGWINVDGTTALNGVACSGQDIIRNESKKKFPWWAILIIVLGSVVVIAVVIIVVVCCCCCKKKKRYTDDDDESSFSSSRSGSFSSRGTSYTGSSKSSSATGSTRTGSSSFTGSTSSGSFSSRGSSSRGSSSGSYGSSSFTGSSSVNSSSRGTSYTGSSSSRSTGTGSSYTASSSRASSSRSSSVTGSSSDASSSRGSSRSG
jgi:hypothetical protein